MDNWFDVTTSRNRKLLRFFHYNPENHFTILHNIKIVLNFLKITISVLDVSEQRHAKSRLGNKKSPFQLH